MTTLFAVLLLCTPSPLKMDFKLEKPIPKLEAVEKPKTVKTEKKVLLPDPMPWMRPDYPHWLHYQSGPFKQPIPEFYIELKLPE